MAGGALPVVELSAGRNHAAPHVVSWLLTHETFVDAWNLKRTSEFNLHGQDTVKDKSLFYRCVCAVVSTPTRSALLTQELPGWTLSQADALWVERAAALAFTQKQLSLFLTNLNAKRTQGSYGGNKPVQEMNRHSSLKRRLTGKCPQSFYIPLK